MTSNAHGGSRSDRYLRVAGWAFLVAIAMRYGCNVASDPDIWWHLASGRLICDEGGFPEHDLFSYSETRASYVYHEWLSSVIFYLLYSRVSPVSVYLLKALLAAAVVLMMMRRQQRALSLPRILFWGLVLSVVGRGFGMRAQIFSYALFALTLLLLDLSREHKRRNMIWLLIPLMALWANLHGAFIGGIGVILLHATEREMRKRVLIVAFLATLATAIHPAGVRYWSYLAGIPGMKDITEWQSIFSNPGPALQIVLLWLICLLWLVPRWKQYRTAELLCLAVTLIMSIRYARQAVLFGICAGMILPRINMEGWAARDWLRPFSKSLVASVLVLFSLLRGAETVLGYIDVRGRGIAWTEELNEIDFPAAAVSYMRERKLTGNLAVTFEYGAYCIWKLYPAMKVSFDGRYEVYTERAIRQAFDFHQGKPGWDRLLERASYALVDPRLPAYYLLRSLASSEWKLIYYEPDGALFERTSAPPSHAPPGSTAASGEGR